MPCTVHNIISLNKWLIDCKAIQSLWNISIFIFIFVLSTPIVNFQIPWYFASNKPFPERGGVICLPAAKWKQPATITAANNSPPFSGMYYRGLDNAAVFLVLNFLLVSSCHCLHCFPHLHQLTKGDNC